MNNKKIVVITYVVGASHVVLQFVCVVAIRQWFVGLCAQVVHYFGGPNLTNNFIVQFLTSPSTIMHPKVDENNHDLNSYDK